MSDRVKIPTIKKEKIVTIIKSVIAKIVSGMLGFAICWLFDGNILIGAIVIGVIAVTTFIAWLFTVVYEKKVSILETLNEDIKAKKYQEAVKLGCSVSRAFFLAGKNQERYRISEKVTQALDRLEGEIIVNEQVENVALLKAKILIDECGWSLYLSNRFGNRKAAESRVKEGINQCLGLSTNPRDAEKTFWVVFRGIRHLYGMAVDNLDETSVDQLKNNPELISEYRKSIQSYGGLLGCLIDEKRMYDVNNPDQYYRVFQSVSMNAQNASTYYVEFEKWCRKSVQTPGTFLLSTYNFRTKHFLSLLKLDNAEGKNINQKDFLDCAKDLAIKMTLGYAASQNEYDWLLRSVSFADVVKQNIGAASIKPDFDRFVKGYVLVGKVAMGANDLHSLEDARMAFKRAVKESVRVNRTDTYLSAQRKLISTNERIFNLKRKNNYLDVIDKQEEVQKLMTSMEEIQKETKTYLGRKDSKMESSCKERRKRYKKLLKTIKKENKLMEQEKKLARRKEQAKNAQ